MIEPNKDFLRYCKNGELSKVIDFISKVGVLDINLKNSDEISAISLAAYKGHHDVVLFLLKNGADINSEDIDGDTPLFFAARFGYEKLAELLIEKGADVDHTNHKGESALVFSVVLDQLEVFKLLINSNPCLQYNSSSALFEAAYMEHDDKEEILINKGAYLDFQNQDGDTALMYACRKNFKNVVDLLINAGANQNLINNEGVSAFEISKRHNYIQIMISLKPELINEQDENGTTLLMIACLYSNEDNVIFLHSKGADFFIENNTGQSAIDILNMCKQLPEKLQALKEQLALNIIVEDHDDLTFFGM